jgi:hypothetical protein
MILAKEAGLHVLAITWQPLLRQELGQMSLDAVRELGFDHIDISFDRHRHRQFVRAALAEAGNPTIPIHFAIRAAPLNLALRLGIANCFFTEDVSKRTGRNLSMGNEFIKKDGGVSNSTYAYWRASLGWGLEHDFWFQVPDTETSQGRVEVTFLDEFEEIYDPSKRAIVTRGLWAGQGRRAGEPPGNDQPVQPWWTSNDLDDPLVALTYWFKWVKFAHHPLQDWISFDIRAGNITRAEGVRMFREHAYPLWNNPLFSDIATELGISIQDIRNISAKFTNSELWPSLAKGSPDTNPKSTFEF